MEFTNIQPPKFDIHKPPKAYPDSSPDRDLNYDSEDKDFSKSSEWSPGDIDNIHARSDVDSSRFAQHHTLGSGNHQASPGNHRHDGTTSAKLGAGLGLVLTGSKGGNVALTNLINMLKNFIEFTDSTT